jgi:hypothetical protein
VLGPLLGVIGLRQTRPGSPYRGRGRAAAGCIIGGVACVGWAVVAGLWNVNVRRPLIEGPRAALTAGFAGDARAFMAAFTEPPAGGETEASAFIEALRSRYGGFRTSRQRLSDAAPPEFDPRRPRVRYRLEFERATVDAEAVFVITDPDGSKPVRGFVLRFAWLLVHDADQGDLAYPTVARPPAANGSRRGEDS